jgi:hypothetical protein
MRHFRDDCGVHSDVNEVNERTVRASKAQRAILGIQKLNGSVHQSFQRHADVFT